jgi:hypothetical protein
MRRDLSNEPMTLVKFAWTGVYFFGLGGLTLAMLLATGPSPSPKPITVVQSTSASSRVR